jgi:hypothetical protein
MQQPHSPTSPHPDASATGGSVDCVVAALPALPPVIRYRDEFDDTHYSIRHPERSKRLGTTVSHC